MGYFAESCILQGSVTALEAKGSYVAERKLA